MAFLESKFFPEIEADDAISLMENLAQACSLDGIIDNLIRGEVIFHVLYYNLYVSFVLLKSSFMRVSHKESQR